MLLLRRVQVVIKIRGGGQNFRAFASERTGFFLDQGLRAGFVEFVTGHQRLQFCARVFGGAHQGRALLLQLCRQSRQTLLLRIVQLELLARVVDHFGLVLCAFCISAVRRAMPAVAARASAQASHQDTGAEDANQSSFEPRFHEIPFQVVLNRP